MDDKRSGNNIFELFAAKKTIERTTGDGPPTGITGEYQALEIEAERQDWLCFYEASGIMRLLPYADLIQVIFLPSELLIFQYPDRVVTVEGRNLGGLTKLVQMQTLTAIYCFVEGYPEPPDDGETPVITSLRYLSPADLEAES